MESLVAGVLLTFLVVTAIGIIVLRDLLAAVILLGVYSLIAAGGFVVMDAVDVAFTEAAVGAGISTILFLGTLSFTRHEQKPRPHHSWPALFFVVVTGCLLIYGTLDMPFYGSATSAAQSNPGLAVRFLEQSGSEVGPPNIVTSVLASYRGYDTLGETLVVFAAGIAVLSILGLKRRRPEDDESQDAAGDKSLEASDHSAELSSSYHAPVERKIMQRYPRQRHRVLQVVTKLVIPSVLMFGLYVQFHGDYGPGGGFQAGVIFAAAFILYGLIFGLQRTRAVLPPTALRILMCTGVLLYAGTGLVTILLGGNLLDYNVLAHDPLHGQHWGIFAVELGVGITVTGVMISLFYNFASRRTS